MSAPDALTAIYGRVSVDVDPILGTVPRQLEDGAGLCDRNGWANRVVFKDEGISASRYSRRQRPGYEAMMEQVRSGQIRRIVVQHVDRLYRRPRELEELIELTERGAVEVISVYSGLMDLSNSDGATVARVLVAMAAKSSDDMSRRNKREREAQRSRGLTGCRVAAFGWADETTPDPETAPLVVAALKAIVAGESLTGIAKTWNRAGVPQRTGTRGWDAQTVKVVLLNPRHAGRLVHKGVEIGQAAWEPIVSAELQARAAAMIHARGTDSMRASRPRRVSMLTGLVRCANCGFEMVRSASDGKAVYVCKAAPNRPACGHNQIQALPVDVRVVEAVWNKVDFIDLADVVADTSADEANAIMLELADLDRMALEYEELAMAREMSPAKHARMVTRLEDQQKALRDRLGRLNSSSPLTVYAGKVGALKLAWEDLEPDKQRAIVVAAIGGVTIRNGRRGRGFDVSRLTIGIEPAGEVAA
jgi:DNA invertase Pin-like site-specific DNA recombinase